MSVVPFPQNRTEPFVPITGAKPAFILNENGRVQIHCWRPQNGTGPRVGAVMYDDQIVEVMEASSRLDLFLKGLKLAAEQRLLKFPLELDDQVTYEIVREPNDVVVALLRPGRDPLYLFGAHHYPNRPPESRWCGYVHPRRSRYYVKSAAHAIVASVFHMSWTGILP